MATSSSSHSSSVSGAKPSSYTAAVHQLLSAMAIKAEEKNPSRTNVGTLIGRTLFWDTVQSYAKKQSDLAWKALETEEVIDCKDIPQGEHILHETKEFIITAKMTAPFKAFSVAALADVLAKSKYKVPRPFTADACEQAKLPGKGRCTMNILER